MPKLTKLTAAARRASKMATPSCHLSPVPSTSHCASSPGVRNMSPPEIDRKVRGRPLSRTPSESFGFGKVLHEQLQKILGNTNKVMSKLHALGIESSHSSSDDNENFINDEIDKSTLSPTSGHDSHNFHKQPNNDVRHKQPSVEKARRRKRRHARQRLPSPCWNSRRQDKKKARRCVYSGEDSSSDEEKVEKMSNRRQNDFNEFLLEASKGYKESKGKKPLYPCEFIRNDNNKKIPLGMSSWSEHFGALFIMCRHPDVPTHWSPFLLKHMEDLSNMADDWAWPTCLKWSEKVFRMIEDGRLASGWTDGYAIKDVQRDICLLGTRAKLAPESKPYDYKSRPAYDKLSDGTPCKEWNEGKECGFTHSHGTQPNRYCHLCSWCVQRFGRTNAHREIDCINKRKYEKPATSQTTDTNKDF